MVTHTPLKALPPLTNNKTVSKKMVNFFILSLVCFCVISSTVCTLITANKTVATCPEDQSLIEPCTCIISSSSSRETVQSSLPSLSCINFLGNTSTIPLEDITKRLADQLTSAGQSAELDRLLVVNGQLTGGQLTANQLGALQYHYLSVYETNLTTVKADAFTVKKCEKLKADFLTYILFFRKPPAL